MNQRTEEPMVFVFPKECGAVEIAEIRAHIVTQLDLHHPVKVIFDLRQCQFIDSSAIGFILGRYKQLDTWNGTLLLYGVSAGVSKVLRLSGLFHIMKIIEREEHEDA